MYQARERFVTDGVGNRLTKVVNDQTETYTYVTGTNKIQEVTGPVGYTHDANGNITGIESKVLTYNQNNRLIRVEENSNILGEYTYNGEGKRVIKTAGGVTTVFHYDFNGNIIAESDENGNFVYEYLYKGGSRLALVDVASGEIYSFLNDRLGTPQMLADSTNTVVWEAIYKPFGEADVNPNSSVVNNFRFPGQYYDEETGFHYNYHRYYDPKTGRYLMPDPIGLAGGINLFVYASNNPVNNIDPLGLIPPGWWERNGPPPSPSSWGSVNPSDLRAGADEYTGAITAMAAGASLAYIGQQVSEVGVTFFAIPGPVGFLGGTIVTTTGVILTGSGVITFYFGYKLLPDEPDDDPCE